MDEERVAGICRMCAGLFSRVVPAGAAEDDWRRHYCQHACRVADVAVRSRAHDDCPTPDKRRYTGEGAAMSAASHCARTFRRPYRWYRCQCGLWHLTTHRCAPGVTGRTVGPSAAA